jgi:N-acyl-D-amino-acid deacylase
MGKILLKGGTIINGTGEDCFRGDLMIEDDRIVCISKTPIRADCETLDCAGMAVAPGFIDAHSHNDWYMASDRSAAFIEPFIRQGITTFIGGNCGFGVAGFKKDGPHKRAIRNGLFASGVDQDVMPWDSWAEYFEFAQAHGIPANLAVLAGHGTSLGSVAGMTLPQNPNGYAREEIEATRTLLEQGMDEGCKGVSLGLAYRPGIYADLPHILEMAKPVVKRGKILAVHRGVERNDAPPGEEPRNIQWLRGFLDMMRDAGVRVQISHLIFPWRNTWTTCDAVMELVDRYIADGMDLCFDIFPYNQGASEIAIVLPADLPRLIPRIYTDKSLQEEVAERVKAHRERVGQYASDIQLANPIDPELQAYKGMFLDEIARERGMSEFESSLDIYRRTNGTATVYMHAHNPPGQVEKMMRHSRALYMTDAWIEEDCIQNPAAFGSMPKFLRLARETGNPSLEQTIARMTGRTAERFDLKNRGLIQENFYADLTVFRAETIAESDNPQSATAYPVGVEHVWINGVHVLANGRLKDGWQGRAGKII